MLEVGDVIGGRLRIDRILGCGGMGIVAAATHLELRQPVAVKMLLPRIANDATSVERFLREARAAALLCTEHVCRVLDAGRVDGGAPYIVMELLAGEDLGSALARGPLPVDVAIDAVLQACDALRDAHARGIVHRDVKPSNLFVVRRPDGRTVVKVLDFGIAKVTDELRLTHSAAVIGSPAYMSPEQLHTPRDVDARADIWSLGVTLYQLITGTLPFTGVTFAEVAMKITTEGPHAAAIDPELRAVIWRCLEKDRSARFPSVDALASALAACRSRTRRPRRRVAALVLASGVLAGGGALAGYLASNDAVSPRATPAPEVAAAPSSPMPEAVEAPVPTTPAASASPTTRPAPVPAHTAPSPVPRQPRTIRPAGTTARGNAKALAQTEATIRQFANQPDVLPPLYMAATALACGIPDEPKARAYYAKLTDAKLRTDARRACQMLAIDL